MPMYLKGADAMDTQTAEPMTAETIRLLYRRISALSNDSMKKLYDYVETLIEEEEDAEDVAYIESLTPEDYADTVPLEEVIADYEKQKETRNAKYLAMIDQSLKELKDSGLVIKPLKELSTEEETLR